MYAGLCAVQKQSMVIFSTLLCILALPFMLFYRCTGIDIDLQALKTWLPQQGKHG